MKIKMSIFKYYIYINIRIKVKIIKKLMKNNRMILKFFN